MSLNVTTGATLSGGSVVALANRGTSSGGKVSFVTPTSTQLEPRIIDFLVKTPVTNGTDPGVARAGLKIAFASRTEEEGCCTTKAGTVIVDLDIRWPLSQPSTVLDDVISYLRGLVYTQAFVDSIKLGILPS